MPEEPLAEILAEMREWSTDENDALARYADRIEAAVKKQKAMLDANIAPRSGFFAPGSFSTNQHQQTCTYQ